jgi:hypothetical protein
MPPGRPVSLKNPLTLNIHYCPRHYMLRRSREIPISQWMRKPSISTILNELHDPISQSKLTTNPETLKLYMTTRSIPVFTRNENSCGSYLSQNQPEQKVTLQYNDLHNHDWVRGLGESHAYNFFLRRPRRPALNTTYYTQRFR